MRTLKVRNKNAMLELLQNGANFQKISVAGDLQKDDQTREILDIAHRRGIDIEKKLHKKMEKGRSGRAREAIIGYLVPDNIYTLKSLISKLYDEKRDPFFLLINRVEYTSNIGTIARTAFAAGVNGLIYQGDEERFLNEETLHFSMGTLARIPLVKTGIFEALGEIQKNGIKTYALEMGGKTYFKEDLTGPAAFVLGAEGEGLSEQVLSRCNTKLSLPMQEGIDSLNVGASAAVILYEKVRQEKIK